MKWVKKALAVTLAAMLVLPSIGAMADEADATAISEAAEQQPAAVPDVSGEDGKTDSETVSGNGAAGEETTANEMKTEAVENTKPAEEVQPDTLAETQTETEPVSGNQADPAKVVRYNTGNCVMGVTDEETLNAMGSAFGELYADLEEDAEAPDAFPEFPDVKTWNWGVFEGGSYTINIPEENPFFPYEVQFTYQGNTWSEWFMSPEDTVEVGGNTFAVSAYFDDTAITQMSLEVGGDTIVVYPEEKTFTNDGDGTSETSMQSLTEHNLKNISLTGYSPIELSMIKVSAVIGSQVTDPAGATTIAWVYGSGDDYKVSRITDGIMDLSSHTSYGGGRLVMIAGDGDPLNQSNHRYMGYISVKDSTNWLTPTLYAQSNAGARSQVTVLDSEYYDYSKDNRRLRVEYRDSDVKDGDTTYISLAVNSSLGYTNLAKGSLKVYEGAYTTVAAAMAGKDITSQIMATNMTQANAGYPIRKYRDQKITMVYFDASGNPSGVLPFVLYASAETNSISWNSLAAIDSTGNRTSVEDDRAYQWIEDDYTEDVTITLYKDYPANGTYYQAFNYYKDGQNSDSSVTAAYIGNYTSIAAAQAAGASDIKNQLFSSNGWPADYSKGVYFSIFVGADGSTGQEIYRFKITTETGTRSKASDQLSSDTAVRFAGFKDIDESKIYIVPYNRDDTYNPDSYGENNYRTILVDSSVDISSLYLLFETADGVNLYTAGSSTPEISGAKAYDFTKGAVHFTASAEDKKNARNYWLQVKKVVSGSDGQLYINSLAAEESKTETKDGVIYSNREVMLDGYHDYVHDIWLTNIGATDIPNLSVELTSDMLKLDEYWKLSGAQALAGFTSVTKGNSSYAELSNLAKVRLVAKDGVTSGDITGTLTFKSNGTTLMVLNLTGTVGDPRIDTTDIPDAVKYVPYGTMIQNNNKYSWNRIRYWLSSGRLPDGMELKENGEIYGVPKEAGEFKFTVTLSNSISGMKNTSAEFTLTVKENTNLNVYNESDTSYQLLTPIGVETASGNRDFYVAQIEDKLFVSEGVFPNFIDLWLNGEKLRKGVDYTAESGSTRITISAQTLQNKATRSGNNTIAAEFRVNGDVNKDLRRTAQNFRLGQKASSDNNGGDSDSGSNKSGSGSRRSGEGSGNTNAAEGVTIAGCILDANGNHLSGVTVELHSTPRSTVTDGNGFFQFANVEYGQHELFVKDQAGNIMASQKFEVTEGSNVALNGFVLTVPKGGTIPLAVKVANGALTFSTTGNAADAAAQAAAAYAASAATGDDENPVGWLMALLISGCMAAGVVVYHRRKARIS